MKRKKDIPVIVTFLLPGLVIYTIFMIFPLLLTIYYSFTEWNGVGEKVFIGLENYAGLIENKDYWRTFFNTLQLVVISVVFQMTLGILIAYLLYSKTRWMKLYRTIYFLPVVIAPVAIGLMFSLFYNSEIGIFNKLLEAAGLGALQTNWLSNVKTLLYAVMAPQVWQYIGLYITIFLGALQSVPEDMIEGAEIDGAGKIQILWKIILPQIKSFVCICLILCVTGSLKSFDHSWIMTKGGPGVRSAYLGVYMYRTSFVNSDFGTGSTVTVTIVLLSLLFTLGFNLMNRKLSDETD